MSFAKRIEEQRTRLGLTQPEAAAVCGVSVRLWRYWESGERTPLDVTQEGVLARLTRAKKRPSR